MSKGPRHEALYLGDDDTGCNILHIDMDAFYASVELIDRPELKGKPVVIGGTQGRGVVLSATYEARAFGVHAAMPVARAQRMCPQAIFISPSHHRYDEVSKGVMAIFRDITPYVEPLSLDEAFLDVSGAVRRLGRPREIAAMIRTRVEAEQRITCSVGVAANKFVAKVASTTCKPNGLFVVPADRNVDFLHPMPVGALWGVGPKTEEQLHRLGLRTVGDLAHTPLSTLERALGVATGRHLSNLAWGRDDREVETDESERSIGNEETFFRDLDDPEEIKRELLKLSEQVTGRVRAQGLVARTFTLKVRFADFTTITRSKTLPDPTDTSHDVYSTIATLYDALHLQRARVRLVGVRAEGLLPAGERSEQLTFDTPEHGWRDADRAKDRATARFGKGAVKPARLLPRDPDRR